MRRTFSIMLLVAVSFTCAGLFFLLAGCSQTNTEAQTNIEAGPFTPEPYAFDDTVPAKVDDAVIQACYDYIAKNGYKNSDDANEKAAYKSVLLGEANMQYVNMDDKGKKDMLDKNDYLIAFGFVNIVVDSDTHVILGRIPLA